MTERRPHWDDDLVGPVTELVGAATVCWEPPPDTEFQAERAADIALRIIAAVEDWQAKNYVWASMIDKLSFRAETAEARVEYLEAKLAGQ